MEFKVKYTDASRIKVLKENESLGYRVGSTETFADGSKEFTFTSVFPDHIPPEDFKASYHIASTSSDKLAVISRLLGLV